MVSSDIQGVVACSVEGDSMDMRGRVASGVGPCLHIGGGVSNVGGGVSTSCTGVGGSVGRHLVWSPPTKEKKELAHQWTKQTTRACMNAA